MSAGKDFTAFPDIAEPYWSWSRIRTNGMGPAVRNLHHATCALDRLIERALYIGPPRTGRRPLMSRPARQFANRRP